MDPHLGDDTAMRYLAKVTAKGQITIPKPVRELLAVRNGDYVIFEPRNDRVVVKKALSPTEDFEALARRVAERFREKGIKPSDVADAIRCARRQS